MVSIITKVMEKQTEIIIEFTEKIELENSAQSFEGYCSDCKKLVKMATPQVCSLLQNISEREIFRQIEQKQIHFIETKQIFVCLDSLKNS